MKTPLKAVVTAALATGILLGGPAMATADDNVPNAGDANTLLTQAITLKPLGGAPIYDQLGGMTVLGMGVLMQAAPMPQGAFPASAPIQGPDGQFYRAVGIERCGLTASAYFISDKAVATDQPRTPETDATYRADVTNAATLPPFFDGTGTLSDGSLVPMTDAFTYMGTEWRSILTPGPEARYAAETADITGYTPNTCAPNAASPFAPEPTSTTNTSAYPNTPAVHAEKVAAARLANADTAAHDAVIYERLQTAAREAIADKKAAATTTVESNEQGGKPAAGIWMIAGAGLVLAAGAAGMAVSKFKKEGTK